MSQHRDEHLDLCAGYALGSLDESDRKLLESHLSEGCSICEPALETFAAGTVLLAASAPAARPSSALKSRVLSAVRAEGESRHAEERKTWGPAIATKPRWTPFLRLGWALAACFILITGILVTTTNRLREDLARARDQVSTLSRDLDAERRWAAVLAAPGARVASFTLTPAGQVELRARATVDPTTRRALLVFENFTAPSGHDYELWALRGNTPLALGLIRPDASGRAVLRIEDVGDASTLSAFAVSLEPAGGAPTPNAPTGPVVMIGALGG